MSPDTFCIWLVCNQVTESMDSGTEVECQDQPETAVGQEVQSEATESTEVTEQLKLFGASESKCELEEELEQSTGPSLDAAFTLWRVYMTIA